MNKLVVFFNNFIEAIRQKIRSFEHSCRVFIIEDITRKRRKREQKQINGKAAEVSHISCSGYEKELRKTKQMRDNNKRKREC